MFFVCRARAFIVCLARARRRAASRSVSLGSLGHPRGTPVCRVGGLIAGVRQSRKKRNFALAYLLQTSRAHRVRQHSPETRSAPSSAPRYVQSAPSQLGKKRKKRSPFRIRRRLQFHPGSGWINVEIVARRCSSTSEMKYLLLKVEKRCQTTIEKILKSIVDERRSPKTLASVYRGGEQPTRRAWDRQLRAAPATGSARIWCVSHHSSRNAAQWPCEGCPS